MPDKPLDEEKLEDELAEGALDPDEIPPSFEPWDEGADDEAE